MKTVLMAGGFGAGLSEETSLKQSLWLRSVGTRCFEASNEVTFSLRVE